MKNRSGPLLLLLTAVIWGTSFVAQSVGMDYIGPFTFTFLRSMLGGLVLIPCIFLMRRTKNRQDRAGGPATKAELAGGVCCGLVLCAATSFQTIGIVQTTVGKAGFITALYVVIVPVIGCFLGRKPSPLLWISVTLAVIGLYLLCMTNGPQELAYGDLLEMICAVLFSVHILVIDYFSPKGDGVVIACIQFFVCGIVSGVIMLFAEEPDLGAILAAKIPILYAGVLSSGVAYTLQIVGQKGMNPTVASLILCLESVVSALAGWLILDEKLGMGELTGCVLMFAAIVLAQLPAKERIKKTL